MTRAILASLVLWPTYTAMHLALQLLGFVLIPVAIALRQHDGLHWRWWLRPWDNLEHGIAGPPSYRPDWPRWRRILVWSAWRNPVNGLRFMFGVTVDPPRIRYVGNSLDPELDAMGAPDQTFWAFTWQGPLAGFKLARAHERIMTEVWLGWKLLPRDRDGVVTERTQNVGFALQPFNRWRFR